MSRVWLVGGGPSAETFNPRRRKGLVVGINDSARHLSRCDVVFSADGSWAERRRSFLSEFTGRKVVAVPQGFPFDVPGVELVRRIDTVGISRDPGVCYNGDNSGFACLSWAVAQGWKDIVLVGYDLNVKGHWYGGYEFRCRKGVRDYPAWADNLERVAPMYRRMGVRIRNANPDSAVRCFAFLCGRS